MNPYIEPSVFLQRKEAFRKKYEGKRMYPFSHWTQRIGWIKVKCKVHYKR